MNSDNSNTFALLSRFCLEEETKLCPFYYLYPFKREMYRMIEPSQRGNQPPHVPVLHDLLKEYFGGEQVVNYMLPLITPFGQRCDTSILTMCMMPCTIQGDPSLTIYVDIFHDTHEYVIERICFYSGVPSSSIRLHSNGEVVDKLERGDLGIYTHTSTPLSYSIIPYTAEPPPRLDLSYEGVPDDTPRAPCLIPLEDLV
jgi:hypothetical protein